MDYEDPAAELQRLREENAILREQLACVRPPTELLAQARAAKAECGKLHRQLNALRKEVTRDLGRFGHDLSAATSRAAPLAADSGGGSGAHSAPARA